MCIGFVSMDDTTVLLQEVRRMNPEALTKVFDLYAHALYKYAFQHCGSAIIADQIVGDVFAKLLEHLSQGNGPSSNIRSYLFEIAYHAIVDEVRYHHRVAPIGVLEFTLQDGNSTDKAAEKHMLLDSLWRAMMNDLTDYQRYVIILRLLEGFSVKETAMIMGKNENNIKVTQNRAVAALRKVIDDPVIECRVVEQDTLVGETS